MKERKKSEGRGRGQERVIEPMCHERREAVWGEEGARKRRRSRGEESRGKI